MSVVYRWTLLAIPSPFETFTGYNTPELSKHRKISHTNLNGDTLRLHALHLENSTTHMHTFLSDCSASLNTHEDEIDRRSQEALWWKIQTSLLMSMSSNQMPLTRQYLLEEVWVLPSGMYSCTQALTRQCYLPNSSCISQGPCGTSRQALSFTHTYPITTMGALTVLSTTSLQ